MLTGDSRLDLKQILQVFNPTLPTLTSWIDIFVYDKLIIDLKLTVKIYWAISCYVINVNKK